MFMIQRIRGNRLTGTRPAGIALPGCLLAMFASRG